VLHRPRRGIGTVGLVIVGGFAVIAAIGGFIAPYRTTALVGQSLEAPSAQHLLGTNVLGQDVWSQMLSGTRVSLFMALVAGGGTLLLGTVVGTLAGWVGGRTDAVLMRAVDLVMVIPGLPLLIVLGAYVGPSLAAVAIVIALISWPHGARVVRAQVLSLRNRAHLRASVGFGASTVHVLRRHILPEIGLILVSGLVGSAGRAVAIPARRRCARSTTSRCASSPGRASASSASPDPASRRWRSRCSVFSPTLTSPVACVSAT
jgi:ABC-type dipeptide/oligopeptide/nickel transport system permease subunit